MAKVDKLTITIFFKRYGNRLLSIINWICQTLLLVFSIKYDWYYGYVILYYGLSPLLQYFFSKKSSIAERLFLLVSITISVLAIMILFVQNNSVIIV